MKDYSDISFESLKQFNNSQPNSTDLSYVSFDSLKSFNQSSSGFISSLQKKSEEEERQRREQERIAQMEHSREVEESRNIAQRFLGALSSVGQVVGNIATDAKENFNELKEEKGLVKATGLTALNVATEIVAGGAKVAGEDTAFYLGSMLHNPEDIEKIRRGETIDTWNPFTNMLAHQEYIMVAVNDLTDRAIELRSQGEEEKAQELLKQAMELGEKSVSQKTDLENNSRNRIFEGRPLEDALA
jgi:hypothetical protein